jgi:hypothetical protein
MSKFALLCQAARLLGQVLAHVAHDPDLEDDVGLQLDRTLHSMLTAALDVDVPNYDQITFIFRYSRPQASLFRTGFLVTSRKATYP